MNPIQSSVLNTTTLPTAPHSGYTGTKIKRHMDGTLYSTYHASINTIPQIFVTRSTDDGLTWVDMQFPQSPGYAQSSSTVLIDSKGSLHIIWNGTDASLSPTIPQIKYSTNMTGVWSTPTVISLVTGYQQGNPVCVLDSKDKIHVSWYGQDPVSPTNYCIKYSTNTSGSWSNWVNVHGTIPYYQQSPTIALDSNDKVHIMWSGLDSVNGTYNQIKYVNNVSGSWSAWTNIKPTTSYHQYVPTIAFDNSGKLHVVWNGITSASSTKKCLSYTNNISGSWSAPVAVHSPIAYDQGSQSIISDSSGYMHIVWQGCDATYTTNSQIKYSTNASGSWSAWKNITTSSSICIYPSIAKIPAGIALIYTRTASSIEYGLIVATNLTEANSVYAAISSPTTPKIVRALDGTLYAAYSASINTKTQIFIAKSVDDGATWVDTKFPQIAGYAQDTPSIATDSNSNAHVVWAGMDVASPNQYKVKYSTNASGSWDAWVNISVIGATYGQYQASIAIDSNNKAHVVWSGNDQVNANTQIKYSTNSTGSWSDWINIQTISNKNQASPVVAIDKNDKLHVAWEGTDPTYTSVLQIKYSTNTSGTWSAWSNIQPIVAYHQVSPSVAVDSDGKVHIVWAGMDTTYTTVRQIKYSTNALGSWSSWVNIQPISTYEQYYPKTSIDSNNKVHVTWSGADATNTTLSQIKYSTNSAGTWAAWENRNVPVASVAYSSPSICTANNKVYLVWTKGTTSIDCQVFSENYIGAALISPGTDTSGGRKLVRASDGTLYATYYSSVSSFSQVFVMKSTDNGLTWSDTLFPQVPGYAQSNPSIALDTAGALHVVWQGRDSTYTSLYQIKYSTNSSGIWSTWINIQPIPAYYQYKPTIATDADNKVHIAWYGMDATYTTISQIKYSTNKLGSWSAWINIQPIATYVQYSPSISIDSNSNAHVVWYGLDSANTSANQIKYTTNMSGAWSTWLNIAPVATYSQLLPTVAIDSNNKVHVAWWGRDSGNTTNQVKYTTNVSGSWSAWVNIQSEEGYHQYSPSICIDRNGKVHVAWYSSDSISAVEQVKYSSSVGGVWSTKASKTATYNLVSGDPCILVSGRYLGILYTCGTSIKIINEFDTSIATVVNQINPRYAYKIDPIISVTADFVPEGYTNRTSTINSFDPTDSNLALGNYVQLDGALRLKSVLQDPMTDAGAVGSGRMYTRAFSPQDFNVINRIEVV